MRGLTPGRSSDRAARVRRQTLLFSSAGHFFSHLFLAAYAMVAVELARQGSFGLGYEELLPLMGLGLFLYGAGAIPAGLLGDRWSAPGMLVVFLVGTGLAAGATALAGDRLTLWLGLSAIGLFGSIYHPVGIAWLVRDPANRGAMLGVNGMVGNLAIGLSPVIAGGLIDLFSWRAVFLLPGAVSLATGLLMLRAWRRGDFDGGLGEAAGAPPEFGRGELRRAMLLLVVAVICTGLVFNAISAVLPKFIADAAPRLAAGGMTQLGLVVAPIYLIGAVIQLGSGWLSDRLPVKPIYVGCWLLQILALLALARAGGPVAIAMALLAVTFSVASLPPENVMFARFSPPEWRSTIYGLKFVLAFGLGWPAVEAAGRLYGASGSFAPLFLGLAGISLCALVAACALPRLPLGIRLAGPA